MIVTEHVFPPIPFRGNDWMAYDDNNPEGSTKGWGRTEAEAIEDFNQQVEDEES